MRAKRGNPHSRLPRFARNDGICFMNKFKKTLIIALFSLFFVFEIAVIIFNIFTKAPAHKSLKNSEQAFVIPYTNKGYIAQGITYDKDTDNFFLTGYMKDGSASPIFAVNKTRKRLVAAVRMTNQDGTPFTGHAGGLSLMNGKIYVAGSNDGCFYVFDKAQILSAKKDAPVAYTGILDLKKDNDKIKIAYCTTDKGLIYAGEFYRDPQYILSESHKVQTQDGLQYALLVGFEINADGLTTTAKIAYSTPIEIQGMCFDGNYAYLTTSWGLGKSYVYKYDLNKIAQSGTKQVCGETVPLYNLTMKNMEACYTLPPMAEEIECVDGSFYITNESASNKYVFGKFTGGKWCRSYKFGE